MKHEDEIKKALGISGVYTQTSSYLFKSKDDLPSFQIDMLLDRADQIINYSGWVVLMGRFITNL